MTSLFEKIPGMIGSLLRLAHKPGYVPKFHSGGPVSLRDNEFPAILRWDPPMRFGGRMADDLAQRQNGKRDFHVQISMSQPKSRKRPITDDMAQMCQDLGIEPSMSYEDFSKHLQKVIADSVGLTFEQLRGRWAR